MTEKLYAQAVHLPHEMKRSARAILIVLAFYAHRDGKGKIPLRLGEITGYAQRTIRQILRDLEQQEFLSRLPDGAYQINLEKLKGAADVQATQNHQ